MGITGESLIASHPMTRLVATSFALVLVLAACSPSDDPTLSAVIDDEGETTGFADFSAGIDKSFGVFVCSNDGEVEIESIEPIHTEGDVEFLGGEIYVSDGQFVGAAHGYPPDGIDESKISPAPGTSIESDCASPDGDDRVQLILGARRTSDAGGVIDGFLVETSGGDLEIPLTILLCGAEMEFCEVLEPAEGT